MVAKINTIYDDNLKVYGRPRIYAESKEDGEKVGEKRVSRLMKQEGIFGTSRRRRGPKTTKPGRPPTWSSKRRSKTSGSIVMA